MKRFAEKLTAIIIFTDYNHFCNIRFSRSLPYKINTVNFFNICLIFGPEVFILCKKYAGRGSKVVNLNNPYQAPKMELFAEIVKGSEYGSASFENTNNPSSKKESGSRKNYCENNCDKGRF